MKNGWRLKFVRRRREVSRMGRNLYRFRINRPRNKSTGKQRQKSCKDASGLWFCFFFFSTTTKCNEDKITLAQVGHFKHGGVRRTRAPLVDQYRTSIARCLMSVLELLRACSRNRQDIYSKCDSCFNNERFEEINGGD